MSIFESATAVALVVGGTVYLFACIAALYGLTRPAREKIDRAPSVSVVIAARNEESNIGSVLADLLSQEYPHDKMEIVAVDDCSEDGTASVICSYAECDGRIRLAQTASSCSPYSHKKRAIHEGVLSSKGEIIMTADADCRIPQRWIREMVSHFSESVDLVAGEVYVEGKGIGAGLETLEFTGIQAMAAGLMNIGFPVTCNGANLAYRRAAFERAGGFDGIAGFVSGDDDLLMQKIAAKNPLCVRFVTGTDTAVRVQASQTVGAFLSKRSRWASKIRGYSSRTAIVFLAAVFCFFISIPVALAAALAGVIWMGPLALGYGLKSAGDLLLTGYALHRTGRMHLMAVFPLAEIVHVPYIIFVTLRGAIGAFAWRGRGSQPLAPLMESAEHE